MDRGEALRVPQWLERREARVQAEVAGEIDDVRSGDGDARPLAVVQRVAVRHDHVEPVHGAALEEADENRAVEGGGGRWKAVEAERGSGQKEGVKPETKEGDAPRL